MIVVLRAIGFLMLLAGAIVFALGLCITLDQLFEIQHGTFAYNAVTFIACVVAVPPFVVVADDILDL